MNNLFWFLTEEFRHRFCSWGRIKYKRCKWTVRCSEVHGNINSGSIGNLEDTWTLAENNTTTNIYLDIYKNLPFPKLMASKKKVQNGAALRPVLSYAMSWKLNFLIVWLSRTNSITPKRQDFTPLDVSTSIYKKYRVHAEKMRDFCDRNWDTSLCIVTPVILQHIRQESWVPLDCVQDYEWSVLWALLRWVLEFDELIKNLQEIPSLYRSSPTSYCGSNLGQ